MDFTTVGCCSTDGGGGAGGSDGWNRRDILGTFSWLSKLEELDRQVVGVVPAGADAGGEGGTVVDGDEPERSLDLLVQKVCRRMFRSPPSPR